MPQTKPIISVENVVASATVDQKMDLNDITKKQLSSDLRKYAMAAIDPVIVDPDNIYIYTKVFALYDTGSGSNSSSIKTNIQNAITQWANQVNINNFNSTFKSQDYQRAIGLSDSAISDVSVQTTLLKYIKPTTNQTHIAFLLEVLFIIVLLVKMLVMEHVRKNLF